MKKRKWHLFDTGARLTHLEREVERLAALMEARETGLSALLSESGVPLSQVINEYLYGEEASTHG